MRNRERACVRVSVMYMSMPVWAFLHFVGLGLGTAFGFDAKFHMII